MTTSRTATPCRRTGSGLPVLDRPARWVSWRSMSTRARCSAARRALSSGLMVARLSALARQVRTPVATHRSFLTLVSGGAQRGCRRREVTTVATITRRLVSYRRRQPQRTRRLSPHSPPLHCRRPARSGTARAPSAWIKVDSIKRFVDARPQCGREPAVRRVRSGQNWPLLFLVCSPFQIRFQKTASDLRKRGGRYWV